MFNEDNITNAFKATQIKPQKQLRHQSVPASLSSGYGKYKVPKWLFSLDKAFRGRATQTCYQLCLKKH